MSYLGKFGKIVGIVILSSYAVAGLWYGTGCLVWSVDSFFHRRKQVK